MDALADDGKLISTNKSVAANRKVIPSLIALHALYGCDLVSMFCIGKLKPMKAVNKVPLKYLRNVNANLEEVIPEEKKFVAKCYGQNQWTLFENRCTIWKNKTDGEKKSSNSPVLKSLPPTNEALEMNIKQAHNVAIMWKNCVTGNTPELNPCEYDWDRNEGDKSLRLTTLPVTIKVAPAKILQRTHYKWASTQCKTNKCN